MLYSPATLYVTGDTNIVRRVGKYQPRPSLSEQPVEIGSRPCIPAQNVVIAQTPEIAGTRDGIWFNSGNGIAGVRFCWAVIPQNDVDLGWIEASDRQVEVDGPEEITQLLELAPQDLVIP